MPSLVAKGGFSDVGHPEVLEAGLQPAVMMFVRVSSRISTSSMQPKEASLMLVTLRPWRLASSQL
jgi:hypothetical protein